MVARDSYGRASRSDPDAIPELCLDYSLRAPRYSRSKSGSSRLLRVESPSGVRNSALGCASGAVPYALGRFPVVPEEGAHVSGRRNERNERRPQRGSSRPECIGWGDPPPRGREGAPRPGLHSAPLIGTTPNFNFCASSHLTAVSTCLQTKRSEATIYCCVTSYCHTTDTN